MLTRLHVKNFKNLVDAEIYFGPFTCIVGENGVGKSNLFDAIQLLSNLASGMTPTDAVLSLRDDGSQTGDLRGIFHQAGDYRASTIELEADIIIPYEGRDYRNALATAITTFVTYRLVLGLDSRTDRQPERIIIVDESLIEQTPQGQTHGPAFPFDDAWLASVTPQDAVPRSTTFISTRDGNVTLHIATSRTEESLTYRAADLPRTILSTTSAADSPTSVLTRLEMESWRVLHLNPHIMRQSSRLSAPTILGKNGEHLAAALYRLAYREGVDTASLYAMLGSLISEIDEAIHTIDVTKDMQRDLYTIHFRGRDSATLSAQHLSDGAVRMLGLAILANDPTIQGIVCLEEPENGIHPSRIPNLINLLLATAVDTRFASDSSNPMRQVIVSTHSTSIAQNVPADTLIIAKPVLTIHQSDSYHQPKFSVLSNTWRHGLMRHASFADLLPYLVDLPTPYEPAEPRIIDRPEIQQMMLDFEEERDHG